MNITELKFALAILTENGDVPFITGQPGGGKSDTVKQFAEQMAKDMDKEYYEGPENYDPDKFGFIDLRLNSIDTIDLSGLPMIDKDAKVTKFTRSPYIPKEGHGILFLDELPQAKPSNMAAVSQLILDKRVGAHSLGKDWKIITAGNRTKDRASSNRMPTHISNRLTQLELDFSLSGFIEYMHSQDVDTAAIAFAEFAPGHLESFKPDKEVNCTPRSFITAARYLSLPEDIMYPLMSGTVGEGVTAEFIGFNKIYRNLPPMEEFISNPMGIAIPEEPDLLFATIQKLAYSSTVDNVNAISQFISRIERATPERAVQFWQTAIAKNFDIWSTPECTQFISNNPDILS